MTRTFRPLLLRTVDGIALDAVVHDAPGIGVVLAHGFTGSHQRREVLALADQFARFGPVVAFDFRGHGRSSGESTVGDREIDDVAAAVTALRRRGAERVVTVGFSMGAAVVIRHAALCGDVDAVVAVSPPARWYYRGTPAMRRVHLLIERRVGRAIARYGFGTRIVSSGWRTVPVPPWEAAASIDVPLLVIHGTDDHYLPLWHAKAVAQAAGAPLWVEQGMGHAEGAVDAALVERIVHAIGAALEHVTVDAVTG